MIRPPGVGLALPERSRLAAARREAVDDSDANPLSGGFRGTRFGPASDVSGQQWVECRPEAHFDSDCVLVLALPFGEHPLGKYRPARRDRGPVGASAARVPAVVETSL